LQIYIRLTPFHIIYKPQALAGTNKVKSLRLVSRRKIVQIPQMRIENF